MRTRKATVLVTGDVRRGAAIVASTPLALKLNADRDLERSGEADLGGDTVYVSVALYSEPTATFTVTITLEGLGSAKRKGRFVEDVAVRSWKIPLREFEEDADE
ncbi:MAG TPA: hypothetical protein VES88_12265 [Gemmatimonadaceae bacterium]|nr:hypothetical protein [Gemmatimonadaceae bacterium]